MPTNLRHSRAGGNPEPHSPRHSRAGGNPEPHSPRHSRAGGNPATLITECLDVWISADTTKKSGRGRSSGNATNVYGIKKLRELILELAVRGKLVPQDPKDEPASELLKKIQAEKEKLTKAGKIKNDKKYSPIPVNERPFELPDGWEWAKLGTLAQKLTDGSHNPPKDSGEGYPMLSSQNVNFGKINFESPSRYVSKTDFEIENSRTKIECNDVLLTIVASLGRPAVVPNDAPKFVLQRSVAVIKTDLNANFLCLQLGSPPCIRHYDVHAKGTAQKGIYLGQLSAMPIAVPHLAEQQRIVSKVDTLMALCDQLEAQHNNAVEAHEKIVSVLLETLTQSPDAKAFTKNWQRIATHFDTLFTTETSIDALKQTLLLLAVMGKLVPQNPKDEPVNELLKRIQAEKAKLVAAGKIKKDKTVAAIGENEKRFNLPKGWEWTRLGALVEKSGAGWSPSCEANPRIGTNWGVLKVSSVSWGRFLPGENKALPQSLEARLDCVVELGDFLISRANTAELVARSVVVEECPPNLMLSDKIVRLRLTSLCNNRFLNLANSSPFARAYYLLEAGGTSSSMKNVTREQILNLIIGKPPLEEQHRIVTKVDELMAICDQLKARITAANQCQQKLADVMIKKALT